MVVPAGIFTSAWVPMAVILVPSINTTALWIGGTSYPVSSMPPTSARRFGAWPLGAWALGATRPNPATKRIARAAIAVRNLRCGTNDIHHLCTYVRELDAG